MKRILLFILIIPTLIFSYTKPFIGISVKELPDSLLKIYGKGVLVDSVISKSPATQVGIKKGSIITYIDTISTTSLLVLRDVLKKYKPYDKVKIKLSQEGKNHIVNLTLGEKEEKIHLGVMILQDENRLIIVEIVKNSPAEKGNLKIGDEILTIDSKRVTTPEQISQIIDKKDCDSNIFIKIKRGGNTIKKEISLFYWEDNLMKKSFDKMNNEFIKDMKRIFFILDKK